MSKTTIYYLFLVVMYMLLGQVERRLNMNNRELSDQIIDTVRTIRKIPREQIKNPFEIQVIVVKPKDYGNKERRTTQKNN